MSPTDRFLTGIGTGTSIGDALDSHAAMLALIPNDSRVLEVGCGTGEMTKALADRGCSVVVLEIEPIAAEKAGDFAQRVVVADVEALDFNVEFAEERSDVVIFGDLLEHLREPVRTLRAARGVLAEGGSAVLSIPNVAHGDVRLALLKGEFRYRSLGLLDATHLRFFTRESIEELVRDAGFVPMLIHRLDRPLFSTEFDLDRRDFSPSVVAQVEAEPESRTYQFVLEVVPADAVGRLGAQDPERPDELAAARGVIAALRGALDLEQTAARLAREELYEARDVAIGAEMAQAQALGQLAVLEREVRRLNEECRALAEDAGRRVADVTARIEDIEHARTWRVFEPYRRLRVRLRGTN